MNLKDVINDDIDSVFLDMDDFADVINFDGMEIKAVIDTDVRRDPLEMETNTLASYPWDYRIFAKAADFSRRPKTNDYVILNGDASEPMIVVKCDEEMGMYVIYLLENAA